MIDIKSVLVVVQGTTSQTTYSTPIVNELYFKWTNWD